MARYLRQSTVSSVKLGPFVAPSDGLTPFTTGGFTVKVGAAGGTLAARHDATAITHDADGYYAVELDATDTATVGRLKAEVPGSAGNYLPVWDDFTVLSGAVYDVLFGATAPSTYAGADTAGTTTLLGRLTGTRATNLDNLDAAVSTRSTYAGADTAGTTTLLGRLTATRATGLDNLDAAISTRSTYAGGDTAGTTTLLSRLTAPRATNLDNLDVAVSTRLAAAGYTAPLALATVLSAPRALDAVADGSLTVADALWSAVCAGAGKEDASSGTTLIVKTPSTGSTVRTFAIATSSINPFGSSFPVSRS